MFQEKALARAIDGTGSLVDFSGTWENELHSKVVLIQKKDVLTGIYESAVSDDHTKTTGDLQGYVDGTLISFVVHWRDFQAITAWVGQLDTKTAKINTLWQMTKRVHHGDEWASINAGADYFTRCR
jgi:Avidin family